jgi:heat-inducible transcriptional repressor
MIPERSLEVLRAIVNDYIESNEPVGSKTLVERHAFGVSAATIRNDMALLEEEQLIHAPHTSAGRVPTDKGYRLFVDKLEQVKPLSSAEKNVFESFLSDTADLDETLTSAVRSLSQLTNQVAMVQYPTLGKSKVATLELIAVSETRLLLILVTDSSRVQQHVIELGQLVDHNFIADLKARLSATLVGQPLTSVADRLSGFIQGFQLDKSVQVQMVVDTLLDQVDASRQEKIILAGTANLARRESDFSGSILPVLEAIEEQVVLLKLLAEMQDDTNGVAVRIGTENPIAGLSGTTILASGYENQGSEIAKVGVLGPTRMNYSQNISAVRAVARYLTRALSNQ